MALPGVEESVRPVAAARLLLPPLADGAGTNRVAGRVDVGVDVGFVKVENGVVWGVVGVCEGAGERTWIGVEVEYNVGLVHG